MQSYVDRLKCFWLFTNVTPLSTGQKMLYVSLLDVNNSCFWIEWFTVANPILQFKTSLSKEGLDKARNKLVQVGLIKYKKGHGNQAGKYKLLEFDSNILPTEYTQSTHKAHTQDTQRGAHSTPLIDKDIDIDNSVVVKCARENEINVCRAYEENIGAITGMIAEELDGYAELTCPEVVIYAIKQAAVNNKKSCGYVKGVCKSLLNSGVKTPLDLERHIQEREKKLDKEPNSANIQAGNSVWDNLGVKL